MTKEAFEKARDIIQNIDFLGKEIPKLEERIERFDEYIEWMDGRHNPIKFAGKEYKKVEIKFNMSERVTDIDGRDLFDIVEENKKEFIDFLKKCQNNYKKKLENNKKEIKSLENDFAELDDNFLEASA